MKRVDMRLSLISPYLLFLEGILPSFLANIAWSCSRVCLPGFYLFLQACKGTHAFIMKLPYSSFPAFQFPTMRFTIIGFAAKKSCSSFKDVEIFQGWRCHLTSFNSLLAHRAVCLFPDWTRETKSLDDCSCEWRWEPEQLICNVCGVV